MCCAEIKLFKTMFPKFDDQSKETNNKRTKNNIVLISCNSVQSVKDYEH